MYDEADIASLSVGEEVSGPAHYQADLASFLAAELQAFSVRGPFLAAVARQALIMQPVRDGGLPPELDCVLRAMPWLARLSGMVPVWRMQGIWGEGPLSPAGADLGQRFLGSDALVATLLAPDMVGLPRGPRLVSGIDDPRMISAWFPRGSKPGSLQLALYAVDPVHVWSDGALQCTFDPAHAELLSFAPLAPLAELVHEAFDADAQAQSCRTDIMDMGYGRGGFYTLWREAFESRAYGL